MYDAHVHLQDARLDTCRGDVIEAAVTAGVTGACCCGTSPEDWAAVAALWSAESGTRSAERRVWNAECGVQARVSGFRNEASPDSALRIPHAELVILPAFGVHPWHVAHLPPDWRETLVQLLETHPTAPVGEIGLDGLRPAIPRDVQRRVLDAQLELAVRLGRPVVLHGARAWGELVAAIKPHAARLPGFVAHGFAGSSDILRDVVALGGRASFAGSVCNPQAARVRAAAAAVPSDRLLVETDTPDIFPPGGVSASAGDSRLNQPANLALVVAAVAEMRQVSPAEIAALSAANARRIYGLSLA